MHVKSLKVFCDVVGQRSFSRAADENGISQSGASQVVHQLEERLGVKLIDRSKRPLVPTAEGELYYQGCRQLVQRYYALEEDVRTFHKELAGQVTIASIYSVGLSHMNACVQEFLAKHPKANVRLQYHHPDTVVQLVETDQVDFGLVSFPKASKTIKVDMWREEPIYLVCAPDCDLSKRESIWLDELDSRRMVGFDTRLQIRREIDFVLSSAGADVQVVMEFDNIETIKRAVEIDAGFGLLPIDTVTRELETGSLVAIPIEGSPLLRPLGIVTRQGKELGKTARRFIQLLHEKADHSEAKLAEAEDKPVAASFAQGEAAGAESDLENGVSARS
ncbi:LysR family transcriptional regulator [Bremerella cremea]|uniref:Transcriptional regulator n=1 Tax=Blastopirellula marina TaxID=124 RepID=A0A2S8FIR3_9BACT|nr:MULTISPECIES: LysR family transcriptional regulator [Pirellulaceae]PQO32058.1 transcriptional regulator [Blastopirellula marina]RCS45124.1 LysR family transcriptional regulator [Bremerella cremea]